VSHGNLICRLLYVNQSAYCETVIKKNIFLRKPFHIYNYRRCGQTCQFSFRKPFVSVFYEMPIHC